MSTLQEEVNRVNNVNMGLQEEVNMVNNEAQGVRAQLTQVRYTFIRFVSDYFNLVRQNMTIQIQSMSDYRRGPWVFWIKCSHECISKF